MLEEKIDKEKYEGPSRYQMPADMEIFPNMSGAKFILGLGIGLVCVGTYIIADKTRALYQNIFRKI